MWDMTVRCWHQDPALRPTMAEMVGLLRKLLASLSIEADLSDFLQACKTWDKGDQGKKAQEFADRLDKVHVIILRDIISRPLTTHLDS